MRTAVVGVISALVVGVAVTAVGSGQSAAAVGRAGSSAASHAGPTARPSSVVTGPESRFAPGAGFYPRLVRLSHSGRADGTILASNVTYDGPQGLGVIYRSRDDGRRFDRIGQIADPQADNGRQICCATLFELPRRIGALPAGTMLWAASIGQGSTPRVMQIRAWSSTDHGRTWSLLATIATAPNALGMWEPEFTVTPDGRLVCLFSDETAQPAFSQKLVESVSRDGRHWTPRRDAVALADKDARPGMPVVRRLWWGGYLMSYEICGSTYGCAAYQRWSADGAHWGRATDPGHPVVATDGTHFAHAPNIATLPDGRVALIGQVLQRADGSVAPGNGATMMISGPGGLGPWRSRPAPLSVPDARDNFCPNYTSALLPVRGGLMELASDYDGDKVCSTYIAHPDR